MFIVRRALDIANLLVYVALYTAAERRIKLREITKLQTVILSKIRSAKPRIASALELAFPAFKRKSVYNRLKYFSASIAAAQPDPAAVTACL